MMKPENMPFDGKRMLYGGFEMLVDLQAGIDRGSGNTATQITPMQNPIRRNDGLQR